MKLVRVLDSLIEEGRRVLKILRLGKNDVQTANEVSPPGIDAAPIPDKEMVAVFASTGRQGEQVCIGYLNKNRVAEAGELRLYSTDSKGEEQTFIYLKSDGVMHIGGDKDFMTRYNELEKAFNELRDDFNNFVQVYNTHTHNVTAVGAPTGPVSGQGSSSSADVSKAKIENIKTTGA